MSLEQIQRPIRVAHVLTSLCEGGLERFTLALATHLPRDRFDVRVYSLLRNNPWLDEFRSRGVPVTVFDASNRPGLSAMARNSKVLVQLARAFARDGIDVVHTPDFFPAFMGRVSSLLAGVPHRVHTLHSVYAWYPWFVFPIQRILGRRTDVITGVSRPVIEYSRSREKLPESKYRLVYNGADENRFRPDPRARAEFRAAQGWGDDIVVGSVGARTPRKGHPLLAEAMLPLMLRDPRLRLVIVGSNSSRDPDTRDLIEPSFARHGLADRVQFLSTRPDIESVFRAFDVHCMPSEVEGLSFASIEGLMSGCVSVFSDLPAFREVVEPGRTGFLFDRSDVRELRRALLQAAAVPWSDADWIDRARSQAVERFGQSRMIQDYVSIYQDLAGKSAREASA